MSDEAPASPPPRKRVWDHPLLRRLPLLLVAAVGFFFLLPKVPKDVEVEYQLGRAGNGVDEVSLEVRDAEGKPLHRTVLRGPEARHPVQHLRLPRGTYRVEAKLSYPDRVDHRERPFEVGDDERVDVDLDAP